MTSECYRFEEFMGDPKRPPLFSHVDATYVIHLENNGRLENVKRGLREFYPSRNTCILYNKGYKNCTKELPGDETRYDLIDANLAVFRDAKEKNYKHILVLEDDFIFHPDIRNHTHKIEEFIQQKAEDEFLYFVGCLPGITIPYNSEHYYVPLGGALHAVIYSQSYREQLLLVDQSLIEDWDCFQMHFRIFNRYMYYRPLCYQLFPVTENSQRWGSHHFLLGIGGKIVFQLLQLMNLHKNVEPGYSILYFLSKTFLLFVVFLFCLFLYRNKRLKKNK